MSKVDTEDQDEIICPHCEKTQGDEFTYGHISYHGEDGPVEASCESCDKTFFVEEIVQRTWTATKTGKDRWEIEYAEWQAAELAKAKETPKCESTKES